jgi:hypothetical protein
LIQQGPEHRDAGRGLADLGRRSRDDVERRLAVGGPAGALHGEIAEPERLAFLADDRAKVACLADEGLRHGRVGNQVADDAAFRKHPVLKSWDQPAPGRAAHNPPGRLAIAGRSEKKITRRQSHGATERILNHNWRRLRRQSEGADLAFGGASCHIAQSGKRWNPPQCRGLLDVGR